MAERRLVEIEVLRGIAVVMVLIEHISFNLFHFGTWINDFTLNTWRGAAGVDVFFAISGFVIARGLLPRLQACASAQARVATVLGFLLRRFWRLQPAAWMWLAIPLVLTLTFNRSGAFLTWGENLPAAVSGLLGIANLRLGLLVSGSGVSFPYWSLSLEEQFYLLLPLAALILRRRLVYLLLLLVGWQFGMPATPLANLTRPGTIAAGVLLAIWSRHPTYALAEPTFLANRAARWCFLIGVLAVVGMLQSSLLRPLYSVLFGLLAPLCAALVHAASFDRGYIMRPGLARSVWAWLGARSYAIYLCHITAYLLTREIYFRLHPPPLVVTANVELHYLALAWTLTLCWRRRRTGSWSGRACGMGRRKQSFFEKKDQKTSVS